MAVLELLRVVAYPLVVVLLPGAQVVHDLAKQPEPLAARPALQALQVLHLLLAGYSVKAAAVAVAVLLALAVQAAQEAVALAVVAVAQHAVHTRQVLVV
jgi:hypothetical protein